MQLELGGRRALVLSSSRGLGLGVAEALAAEGAEVAICGRNGDRLSAAAETINARGCGRAVAIRADLADVGFSRHVVDQAKDRLGSIDILVNNSGGPPPGAAETFDQSLLQQHFSQMVARLIEVTGLVLPGMRERGWGRILTIASSGVVQPIPNLALSNTLRSALVGWSKTLAGEVAGSGICVNVLLPGRIATDRVDELDVAAAERQGKSLEEVRAQSRAMIPTGRYGEVREFAAVAAFLCSGPASYVTGSTIRCDGGAIRSI
jgi:3-oxoacyl-[acyl-carrier protein] reductase